MSGKVVWHMTMSLDGFIARPDDDATDWMSGYGTGTSVLADEVLRTIGAFMCGGRLFTGDVDAIYGGAWKGPVLVMTHHPPDRPIDPRVTIVEGDIHAVVEQGLAAAGGKDLVVTGGSIPRQCLQAGLVDEIALHVVPVLLGDGVRFLDCPGLDPVGLERVSLTEADQVTDFRLRVGPPGSVLALLQRAFDDTAEVIAAVPSAELDAASPCEGWTVRDVANHVVGGLRFFARTLAGEEPDASAPDPDLLGSDPAAAYRSAASRCLEGLRRPGALDEVFPFPSGPTPGHVIADVALQESLVHAWDIAQGAGLAYSPDDAAVEAVARFNARADDDDIQREGMFGPPTVPPPDASAFATLLARLGRRPA